MIRKLFRPDPHHRCFLPLAVFFLSLVMAMGLTITHAQTSPTDAPPSCPPEGCANPFDELLRKATLKKVLDNGSDASQFTGSTTIGGPLSIKGLQTTTLKVTTGASDGKILTSDGVGAAIWQDAPTELPSTSGNLGKVLTVGSAGVLWQDTQKELPQTTTTGKVLTSNANGNPNWQDAPSPLPGGTSGQTLRYDGSKWVASGVLTSDGSSVSVKDLLKVGAARLSSDIRTENNYQRYSLGYGIYWDSTQKKYVVTDTQYNQATFSNENGNFTWGLHNGKLTGPLTYADWHKNNKMTLSQDGILTVNGKIKGEKLCIGNDCRSAWDPGQWVLGGQTLRSQSRLGGYYREPLETLTYVKGLVGIGESNPSTTLEVAGDFKVSQAKYTYTKISELVPLDESERSCSCGDDDASTNLCGKSFTTNKNEGEYCWEIRTFTDGGKVYRYKRGDTPVNMALYVNGSTGNVGIGTTNPNGFLQIGDYGFTVGDGVISKNLNTRDGPFNQKRIVDGKAAQIQFNDGTIAFITSLAGTKDVVLRGTNDYVRALYIANDGAIGIGTDSPGAKLEVNGQIKVTGGSPGAGKVMTSDANGTATWQALATPTQSPLKSPVQISDNRGKQRARIFALSTLPLATDNGAGRLILQVTEPTNAFTDGHTYNSALTIDGGSMDNGVYSGSRVGIGTMVPTSKLHVVASGGFPNNVPIVAQSNSTFFGARDANGNERFAINLDSDGTSYPVNFYDKYDGNWNRSISLKNGKVGIGTTDPCSGCRLDVRGGDINVGKVSFLSKNDELALAHDRIGLDVAELFESEEQVEVGDVLVIGEKERKLRKSRNPYDGKIIGVVSGAPALLFEGSELKLGAKPNRFIRGSKPPVALAGRVPVKVSLENGPIEIGDYLTSSSIPGVAMKATRYGATLGIALEPFNNGESGKNILTLVNLGERNVEGIIKEQAGHIRVLEQRLQEIEQKLDIK